MFWHRIGKTFWFFERMGLRVRGWCWAVFNFLFNKGPRRLELHEEVDVYWCQELSEIHYEMGNYQDLDIHNPSKDPSLPPMPTMLAEHDGWRGVIIGFRSNHEIVEIAWHGCDRESELDWRLIFQPSRRLLSIEERLLYPNRHVQIIAKMQADALVSRKQCKEQ